MHHLLVLSCERISGAREMLTSIPVMRWVGSPCALVRSSGRSRRKKLNEVPSLKLTLLDQAEGAVALPFSRDEVAQPLLTTDGSARSLTAAVAAGGLKWCKSEGATEEGQLSSVSSWLRGGRERGGRSQSRPWS